MTTHRPSPLSAVLSVLAGAVAVGLLATTSAQRAALLLVLVGLGPLAAGLELRRRGHRLLGVVLGATGLGLVAFGLVRGVRRTAQFSQTVELLPGVVGLTLLVLGLGPLWKGRERLLFSAGTGLLVVAVVTSGAVYEADTLSLLLAGVLTVVAWDLAEQSVNLGEQVGRDASTTAVELVHGGGTLAVGGVAIALTRGISDANVSGLSLLVLGGLLAAAFTLAVALYN